MLSLRLKRREKPHEHQKPDLTHTIGLELRGKEYMILPEGRIDFVERAGIIVPEYRKIASITLASPKLVNSLNLSADDCLLSMEDENMGKVYASYNQVSKAYDQLCDIIEGYEKHEIDMQRLCPEAQTSFTRGIILSVENIGYFNQFRHNPKTEIPDNYRTNTGKDKVRIRDMTFLPVNAVMPKDTNKNLPC